MPPDTSSSWINHNHRSISPIIIQIKLNIWGKRVCSANATKRFLLSTAEAQMQFTSKESHNNWLKFTWNLHFTHICQLVSSLLVVVLHLLLQGEQQNNLYPQCTNCKRIMNYKGLLLLLLFYALHISSNQPLFKCNMPHSHRFHHSPANNCREQKLFRTVGELFKLLPFSWPHSYPIKFNWTASACWFIPIQDQLL